MRRLLLIAISVGALVACQPAQNAVRPAAPVRVLSSNGVRAVLEVLRPEAEQAIGHPLSMEFSTALALRQRIDGGEPFDVAILTSALIDDLTSAQRVVAGSRRNLARVGVGVGVAAGAPVADIRTSNALRRVLLDARSVAFTADGQSRTTIDQAFARLEITDVMRQKTLLRGPGEAPAAVAAGEAALVLTLVSEIVSVPGLQLLGPLPPELQAFVLFTAARSTNAGDVGAADALLEFLSGPQLGAALASHGLETAER